MRGVLTSLLLCLALLAGPSRAPAREVPQLEAALALTASGNLVEAEDKNVLELRPAALKEEGLRYGLQKAFAWRYGAIAKACEERSESLERLFPFKEILLEEGKVLPPVLSRADKSLSIEDRKKMTSTATAWRIVRPAIFTSVAPSWRGWLLLPQESLSVQMPHPSVLPRDGKERKIWQEAVKEGWKHGLIQAERLFEEAFAALTREFRGMIAYHNLARQGMISIPDIERGHYAVRLGEETLELDQEVFLLRKDCGFTPAGTWISPVP